MGLWKDKNRKDWCYSFQYQKDVYAGRGFNTRRDAEAARAKRKKGLKNKPTTTGMAYSEAVNKYLDHAERRFVPDVYKYKTYVYTTFFEFIGKKDCPIHEITTSLCKSYLDTRHSNNNFNVHRRELSALFSYANDILEVITRNPVAKIEKMPHTTKEKYIPKEEDVIKLIMASDPKTDERDLLMVLLHTLARIDEALRLTWSDINFEKKVLIKKTRKTRGGAWKPIEVKINDELYDVLWGMWEKRRQSAWVFYNECTQDRYLKRPKFMKGLCARAGIAPHFGFHTLRHLMSSLLNDNPKVSKKTIQKILGHASQRTTEIYLHELDGAVDSAMDSISGKFTQKEDDPQPKPATKKYKGS